MTPVSTSEPVLSSSANPPLAGTPNTMIFVYNKEDHTLGNALVDQLHKNSHVTYAAYRVSYRTCHGCNRIN